MRAELVRHRAFDRDFDELARALAVARDLLGEIAQHRVEALAEVASAAGRRAAIFGAPRLAAAPVANAINVSEVDVSPSTVTALNVSATPSLSSVCSAGAEIGASVKMKDSMVAISGAIMPAPLAMPLIVTWPCRAGLGGRDLGEGVGGHDRLGGVQPEHRRLRRATSPSITPSNFVGVERLADHAGRGEEHLVRLAADAPVPRSRP